MKHTFVLLMLLLACCYCAAVGTTEKPDTLRINPDSMSGYSQNNAIYYDWAAITCAGAAVWGSYNMTTNGQSTGTMVCTIVSGCLALLLNDMATNERQHALKYEPEPKP